MESRHLGISVTLALPADTNTPGFENEEKPNLKKEKLYLKSDFISILGFESWLLTLLRGGLFRWGGLFQNIFHASLLGCFLHLHFERIIKSCAKEKNY
uniref:Uncharacterized protein n=1 Tax=Glossina pallidipes TaxID=7398 RepID=A0A1A9ZEB1_GLOPL